MILAIVGQTASGKTDAAEQVAAQINGVIINSDVQQMYYGLPIVTAQSSAGSGELFGFLQLDEPYTSALYAIHASRVIERVIAEGHVPIVVGGSGFYLDALLYERDAPPAPTTEIRVAVAALSADAAVVQLCALDPMASQYVRLNNPRRVSRALEILLQTGKPQRMFGKSVRPRYDARLYGITMKPDILRARIEQRVHQMWEYGVVAEVEAARAVGHTLDEPGMRAIGVKEIFAFLDGDMTRAAAEAAQITATWQYARRQITWFKRITNITWYNSAEELSEELCHSLRDFPPKNLRAS